MSKLEFALVSFGFSCVVACAGTLRVVPSAGDATGDWAGAYTDIQAACDAASDGDTVLLKSGTYELSGSEVRLVDRSLTISGEAEGTVVIDAKGLSRCFSCNIGVLNNTAANNAVANRPCLIEKIVFRNGDASGSTADASYNGRGGGVYLHSYKDSSRITMRRCVVENCTTSFTTASCRGGGLYIGRFCTLEDTVVRNCAVGHGNDTFSGGGGMFAIGNGGSIRGLGPIISRCVVSNCTSAANRGAGMYCYANVYLEDCDISSNAMSAGSGSGIYCTQGGARVLDCRFTGNGANGSGAKGSSIFLASNMVVSNCVFTGNISQTASLYGGGSGTLVVGCTFTNDFNRVWQSEDNAAVTFRNSLFAPGKTSLGQSNQWGLCPGGSGVAIAVENCTFVNMVHALRATNANTFRCVNCVFHGNTLDFFIGESSAAATPFTLVNCGFADYPAEGKYSASDCVVTGDPRFVGAARGDYRLKRTSPCVDRGSMSQAWLTAGAVDLDGKPRVVTNGKPLAANPGAVVDIGCFENQEVLKGLTFIFR